MNKRSITIINWLALLAIGTIISLAAGCQTVKKATKLLTYETLSDSCGPYLKVRPAGRCSPGDSTLFNYIKSVL